MLHYRRFLLSLFLLFFTFSSLEAEQYLIPPDENGQAIWVQDQFRIIYFVSGKHAVIQEDFNKNGLPDYVEDVFAQLKVAHHVFVELVGFMDPLQSSRYKKAKYIDIYIVTKSRDGNRGRANNTLHSANDLFDPWAKSLKIYISKEYLPQQNNTVAHEYFHMIQYGATHINTDWFREGQARWAENVVAIQKPIKADIDDIRAKLNDDQWLNRLYKKSYSAGKMLWIPLAQALPDNRAILLPHDDPILQTVYSDGTPVMKDFDFAGAEFMNMFLRHLTSYDDIVRRELNYPSWKKSQYRRNPANSPYIIKALKETIDTYMELKK